MKVLQNCPLKPFHTFGMDVKASFFVEYDSVDELKNVLSQYDMPCRKWLHIGGGSNLLFVSDYDGVVLHSCIQGYEVVSDSEDEVLVRLGAGVT